MSASELKQGMADRPEEIRAVPVRHPGRWVVAVIVLAIAASIARSVFTNPLFKWGVVWHFMGDARILHGLVATIYLTALAMAIGIALGVILAVMRLSPNRIVSGAAWLYIWFFRGTPVLVQIIFWYNAAALLPVVALGVPFGPALIHFSGNSITVLDAAMLALGLNEGAYMSEIVRAGIISVGEGQSEAAASLGMSRLQIMRHIVLPQAMRVILPPTGNETISMLKTTSLVYTIGFAELLYEATQIYNVNYEVMPLLIVASIWYLVATSIAYVGQYFIERRYGRGFSRTQQATMRERWLRFGGAWR